jgi:hypothetical protein
LLFNRECFSKSILLGSIEDPLLPEPTCTPKVISFSNLKRSNKQKTLKKALKFEHHFGKKHLLMQTAHVL